jgi:polysaccharide chain length determinant protein (PEP-CTERM system associated)
MDSFDIQKYLNMALKRKWWIIIPFLVSLLCGFTYLLVTPRIYEAQTLILVQQQKVPEDYVQSAVSTSITDRLATIQQQVTSRTNLEGIIAEYGLFSSSSRKNALIDSKVESIRKMISITTSKDSQSRNSEISSFTISFRYEDPRKAMEVTNKLASNFISENLKIREEQAQGTSTFLSDELKSTEDKLKQKEEELKEYRERYMGGLPEQLQTNLSILERLQTSNDQFNANLRDAENRRTEVLKDITASQATSTSAPAGESRGALSQPDDLTTLKSQLTSLEARYTQNHPDVIRLRETIAAKEKEQAAARAASVSQISDEDITAGITTVDQSLKRQLQEINLDIADYKAKIDEANAQIRSYQAKVEDSPKREQELVSLNRDYSNLKEYYDSLLNKKYQADLSVSVEKKQKGEQFKVIDAAKIPEKPVEPDMKKIILMTLVIGLGLGCGLAYLMEMMDTSYRVPEDAEKDLQLPVLVNMPFIHTETEIQRMKRNNMLAYTGVSAGFVLSVIIILLSVRGGAGTVEFFKGFFS